MKGFLERYSGPFSNSSKKDSNFNCSRDKVSGSVSSETEQSAGSSKHQKSAIWSEIWPPALSVVGISNGIYYKSESNIYSHSVGGRKDSATGRKYYERWRAAVRRVMMNGGSVRRFFGFSSTNSSSSRGDIWLLGVCYQVAQEGDDANSLDPSHSEGFAAFVDDFSSRILITYRKGFDPIGDTKYASDVYWGCMLRSSQMLVAQAFLVHKLGRSWRKTPHKPLDQSYLEILHLFGDAEDSPCSIHNLLKYGKAYGLAPGSWVGPYAMCRTWESLMCNKETDNRILSSMMTVYVVSGDEDGERGGAPVLCTEDIKRVCFEFSGGQSDWTPILLMVPLVLGVEKVNPRYLPLLTATFTFPQSLGILGGKPGASTYIVGVQDEKAFYLDPHEVQQVVDIKGNNEDVDTSTYHCNVVRHIPLESLDSSLAIGFYCRDKSDFDDLRLRASELISQSNGAPLFTIADTRSSPRPASCHTLLGNNDTETGDRDPDFNPVDVLRDGELDNSAQEDDWQLL